MARRKFPRYLSRREDERCEAGITLKDGSGAQCQRYKSAGSRYCRQHTKLNEKRAH